MPYPMKPKPMLDFTCSFCKTAHDDDVACPPTAWFCPKTEDHKHVDTGGPFMFVCRECGWAEEYGGDSGC